MEVEELAAAAERALPRHVWDFVSTGADDEVALAGNVAAFRRRTLRPRVLADAGRPDPGADVLGSRLPAPVLVAPMGLQCLVHPDGERATSAAAADCGLGYVAATGASVPLEETAGWFQLYLLADRDVTADLVHRAVVAGYRAIVLTADAPVVGHRARPGDIAGRHNANFDRYPSIDAADHGYVSAIRADVGWPDVSWLVEQVGIPVVVKGILRPDDARRALDHGAAGVVVSNHGGRQLGRAVAPLDVLESVVAAVAGRAAVLLDGGVRRPADVLTAVALGADAVLVGRLVLWALAVGGRETVTAVLADLVAGIRRTMTLLGVRDLAELRESGVVSPAAP